MDSVHIFGYREDPEILFLRTIERSKLIIQRRTMVVSGFDLDPRVFQGVSHHLFFQDGILHLTIFVDEEAITLVELARVPNCAQIHNWIYRANQLFARR